MKKCDYCGMTILLGGFHSDGYKFWALLIHGMNQLLSEVTKLTRLGLEKFRNLEFIPVFSNATKKENWQNVNYN
ncbi:hypothetical protein [Microcoleus sp. MON2_D5]|uniref:hypothetical protein n=1 Tax=Microcoleus sp. MON2_D5 TaxID=2818833 RepID=UPI002FD00966